MASIDDTIGTALRRAREARRLTAKELSNDAGVSAPMISRIENGQSSATLPTLEKLAAALDVPLVSLFGDVAQTHSDYTFTLAGQGLQSARIAGGHRHSFQQLASHRRNDLKFEAITVTLKRQEHEPPNYVGNGVVFIQIMKGEAVYAYGGTLIHMSEGDAITLDAELRHGFVELKSPELVFLSVQAETV